MGFNGVRKHQKIEDPRFLYWADRLGLFVWEEMPSCYRFSTQTRRASDEAVDRGDRSATSATRASSPGCRSTRSWGVPDLPDSPAQRALLQALYHLTKTLDPTRPGHRQRRLGERRRPTSSPSTTTTPTRSASPTRYGAAEPTASAGCCSTSGRGIKVLMLDGFEYQNQPIMLTEFGGIAFSKDRERHAGATAGRDSAEEFAKQYDNLLGAVRALPLLAGFCYTQFTDTYQEANGLLYMDRTPKFPIEQIAVATRGPRTEQDRAVEANWRGALMHGQRRRGSDVTAQDREFQPDRWNRETNVAFIARSTPRGHVA